MIRYYHKHLIVACLISLVAVSSLVGAAFYGAREFKDWEGNNHRWFDWPGFLWPVVPLSLVQIGMVIWLFQQGVPAGDLLWWTSDALIFGALAGAFIRDMEKAPHNAHPVFEIPLIIIFGAMHAWSTWTVIGYLT